MKIEEEISLFLKDFEDYLKQEINDRYLLYPLLPSGKRIRPILVYAGAYPGKDNRVLNLALAVELLHTSSLVHDDLPFVDNSPTRRGKPSTHVKFTPGIAVMIGDALMAESFRCAAKEGTVAVKILSEAAGINGIAGGQILDLKGAETLEDIINLHFKKTVKLIEASFLLGLISAERTDLIGTGKEVAREIGHMFQVVDDIIDEKSCGQEPNITKIVGREKALQIAEIHYNKAVELSEEFEGREILRWLAKETIKKAYFPA